MISILIGPKGTGKTKVLIDMVSQALETEKGNIVFITKGDRHKYDISSSVRLVNTNDFNINCIKEFRGLISGMISQNYDITHIFIDSLTKIIKADLEDVNDIIPYLEDIGDRFSVNFTISVSAPNENIPENIKKYLVEI